MNLQEENPASKITQMEKEFSTFQGSITNIYNPGCKMEPDKAGLPKSILIDGVVYIPAVKDHICRYCNTMYTSEKSRNLHELRKHRCMNFYSIFPSLIFL